MSSQPLGKRVPSRVSFQTSELGDDELRRTAELRDMFAAEIQAISRLEAAKASHLAELQELVLTRTQVASEISIGLRSKAAELDLMTGLSDRTLVSQISDAYQLVHDFPATHAALGAGAITVPHVRVITGEGTSIDPDHRAMYQTQCVKLAVSTTPARLRMFAKTLAQELSTHTIDEMLKRHRRARIGRR